MEEQSDMDRENPTQGNTYCIRLKEAPHPSVTDWFGDITILPQENGETLLIGSFPDQPALRGFLDQLWNLHFTVVSVERIGNGYHQDLAS
jgi:hypothetical protein